MLGVGGGAGSPAIRGTMSLKARAEMGLLATLDQPRVSAATQGPKAKISVPPAGKSLRTLFHRFAAVAFRPASSTRQGTYAAPTADRLDSRHDWPPNPNKTQPPRRDAAGMAQ